MARRVVGARVVAAATMIAPASGGRAVVALDALDEGMICHTLRSRFAQDAFYTSVGTNPRPRPCQACAAWCGGVTS